MLMPWLDPLQLEREGMLGLYSQHWAAFRPLNVSALTIHPCDLLVNLFGMHKQISSFHKPKDNIQDLQERFFHVFGNLPSISKYLDLWLSLFWNHKKFHGTVATLEHNVWGNQNLCHRAAIIQHKPPLIPVEVKAVVLLLEQEDWWSPNWVCNLAVLDESMLICYFWQMHTWQHWGVPREHGDASTLRHRVFSTNLKYSRITTLFEKRIWHGSITLKTDEWALLHFFSLTSSAGRPELHQPVRERNAEKRGERTLGERTLGKSHPEKPASEHPTKSGVSGTQVPSDWPGVPSDPSCLMACVPSWNTYPWASYIVSLKTGN